MKFTIQQDNAAECAKMCATIVGVYDNGTLTPAAQDIDNRSQGAITKLLKDDKNLGKSGNVLWLYHLPHCEFQPVLLVGCGNPTALSIRDFRKLLQIAIKSVPTSITQVANFLTELGVNGEHNPAWNISQAMMVSSDALYQFEQFKSTKTPPKALTEISFYAANIQDAALQKSFNEAQAIARGVTFTKDLANLPSNICHPTYLANEARKLGEKFASLKIDVLDEAQMEELGMGAFLAVSRGSKQPAKLICIHYQGTAADEAPVAFVGKGITFDTGGISLKPAESMVGMKYDMCGAATVLGVMQSVAELKLPINVVGVLAAAENMPGGNACKPEDIVTSLSGQTIEILNTDAEGRLVLCDALTYCERFNPDTVIDIATLTGAVVIALGVHASAVLANDNQLAQDLLAAGAQSHDRVWQLPLWEDYQDQLKSPFADMTNVGGRPAGTITAACFLSKFAKKFKWAHLDVAGTAAAMGGGERSASGRPVPLLMQYLINRCAS